MSELTQQEIGQAADEAAVRRINAREAKITEVLYWPDLFRRIVAHPAELTKEEREALSDMAERLDGIQDNNLVHAESAYEAMGFDTSQATDPAERSGVNPRFYFSEHERACIRDLIRLARQFTEKKEPF